MSRWLVVLALAIGCNSDPLAIPSGDGGGPRDLACGAACGDPCAGKSEAECQNSQACVADYCVLCSCTPSYVGCRLVGAAKTPCPALGCAPPCGACNGLGPIECQAASQMGCTAVFCPDCDGRLTAYAGCFGPNEGAPYCPPPSCPNRCRQDSDCVNPMFCYPPDGPPLCGICSLPDPGCFSDADCAGVRQQICDIDLQACSCGLGCMDGCDVRGCPEGQVCGADLRCAPQPCGACPAHFVCAPDGHCARQTCTTDGDCGFGVCVTGRCFDALGWCMDYPA